MAAIMTLKKNADFSHNQFMGLYTSFCLTTLFFIVLNYICMIFILKKHSRTSHSIVRNALGRKDIFY